MPNWVADALLTLTLLPAGHRTGIYEISLTAFVKAAASAGSVNVVLGWDQTGFGAATFNIGTSVITTLGGSLLSAPRTINSSGRSAITLALNPIGVTGSPLLEILCAAALIG